MTAEFCRRLLCRLCWRRQEFDLVLRRQRDDCVWCLLAHVVDSPEQIIELTRRRDPEQALRSSPRLVEDPVGYAHGKADEITWGSRCLLPIQPEVQPAFQDVEVFILCWMNVGRHEGIGGEGRMPGDLMLCPVFGHVSLAEDVPLDPVESFVGARDAGCLAHTFASRLF